MNSQTVSPASSAANTLRPSRIAPIATLLLLSPLIGEVMSGATRISYIFVLIPEIMVWGGGALLIREAVRRWHGGWASMLTLGLALSVAEEFIIQQTSLAPLNWMGVTSSNGRVWGVNLFYFLFMLGYESVWIVLIPVQITELIFPQRRDEPWLRTRGMIVSALVFVLGSFFAWYLWIKQARPHAFHVPDYHVPLPTTLIGLFAIVMLILLGYVLRAWGQSETSVRRTAPRPWVIACASFGMVLPWYLLMSILFIPKPIPWWPPVLAESAWAILCILAINRWASASGWGDMHRWAVSFGPFLFSMVAGFSASNMWPRIDIIGKLVLNVIAIVLMIVLARQIQRRAAV